MMIATGNLLGRTRTEREAGGTIEDTAGSHAKTPQNLVPHPSEQTIVTQANQNSNPNFA